MGNHIMQPPGTEPWPDCIQCAEDEMRERAMAGEQVNIFDLRYHHMFLCPTCGNKRCPKATDHRLACTDSNEPGQEGSVYA